MKITLVVVRALFGLTGLFQLVLGVLMWLGRANGWAPVHMVVGTLFVLSLWVMAAICARAGAPEGLTISAIVWGAIVPVLGMAQVWLVPGPSHWIIRVVHLLTVLAAMALGGRLAAWSRRLLPGPAGAWRTTAPGRA